MLYDSHGYWKGLYVEMFENGFSWRPKRVYTAEFQKNPFPDWNYIKVLVSGNRGVGKKV